MKFRTLLLAAALTVSATQAFAQGFSDTWIGVRDGTNITNAGNYKGARDVNKIIANFGHFDAGEWGSNFVDLDILFSDANEPANNSAGGSTEFYFVYRGQLSMDKAFGINTNIGPFKQITLEAGGDAEAENTYFAPDKKALVAGPNFHIDVPAGFLNIGVHVYHEWNNNGICADACSKPGGPVDFATTGEFEIVWLTPLPFSELPLDFRGFTNIVLPKGKDGFGNQTATEILSRPSLYLDIGKMAFNKPNKLYAFAQLELWMNKFGNDQNLKSNGSVDEVSPVLGVEYHF